MISTKQFFLFLSIVCLGHADIFGNTINLTSCEDTINDGRLIAAKEINLTCGRTFSGTGYLEAPVITIKATTFAFTGTIKCDQLCTIITKNSFNQAMFKRLGNGKFVIKIDPSLSFEDDTPQYIPRTIEPPYKIEPMYQKYQHNPIIDQIQSPQLKDINWGTTGDYAGFPQFENIEKKTITIDGYPFDVTGKHAIDLAQAIENNDVTLVKSLLDAHPDLCNQNELNVTMLMAGMYNHVAIVQEFIQRGAKVNAPIANGTPLAFAIHYKKVPFIKELLQAGADPNVVVCDTLPILIAFATHDTEVVKAVLSAQNLNTKLPEGRTLLMYAAYDGCLDIVELLVSKKMSIRSVRDAQGLNAIDYAERKGHQQVAQFLREKDPVTWRETVNDILFAGVAGLSPLAIAYLLAAREERWWPFAINAVRV